MKTYRTDSGFADDGRVLVCLAGRESPLDPRYDLRNHSPDGFAWGYGGSGPAQLSLALCADALGDDEAAQAVYQIFKGSVVSKLDQDKGWELTEKDILEVMASWPSLGDKITVAISARLGKLAEEESE